MHHKDLEAWKLSMDLVIKIYKITKCFPENEKFALYRKKGGVNIFAFLIALMAVQQLPTIIIEIVNKFLS